MKFPQIMILYSVMVHATVLSTKNALNLPWILKAVSSTHFFSCEVFSTELRNKWIVSKVFCTFDNLHFAVPPGDQGWFCKFCECRMDIIEAMNAHLGTHFSEDSSWQVIVKILLSFFLC